MAQTATGIEPQIRRRKAELAAAFVAVDHGARHEPGIAQEFRRLAEPSGGERVADRAGRYRASIVLEARHHIDGKAALLASATRKSGEPRGASRSGN